MPTNTPANNLSKMQNFFFKKIHPSMKSGSFLGRAQVPWGINCGAGAVALSPALPGALRMLPVVTVTPRLWLNTGEDKAQKNCIIRV